MRAGADRLLVRSRSYAWEAGAAGGGGISLFKPYGMCLPKGCGFWAFFGLKTGIDFAHFGLESASMVFEGTTGVYECIYRFNSK